MRNILATIMLTAAATAILLAVFNAGPAVAASWAAFGRRMDEAFELAFMCGRVLLALGAGAVIVWAAVYVSRAQWKMQRPQDGSFALREYWLEPLPRRILNWFAGRPSVRVLVNPNNDIGAVRLLGPMGTLEPAPSAGWPAALEHRRAVQATHNLQAINPGDDVIDGIFGHRWRGRAGGVANAATAKLLTGKYDPEPPKAAPAPASAPSEAVRVMRLPEALAESARDKWILGMSNAGAPAVFSPALHHNIGIVGAQGTGKTACSGFHVLALALQFGMHPIILDPKGGIDFRQWEGHAEWHPTDAGVFGDQVGQLLFEHKRRQAILQEYQAPNMDALPASMAKGHVLVLVEEFGALWEDMQSSLKPAAVTEVGRNLDTLMRLSRATGIHWCVIDQFPDKWSKQVFAALKCRLVYKVAPGQDNFMREYGADQIADRGQFMMRQTVFNAWHVGQAMPKLLTRLPASTQPAMVGSVSSVPVGDTPSPEVDAAELPAEPASEPNTEPAERAADKRKMIFEWRDANPAGTQTEFRAWAFRQGVHVAKGYTSDTWKLYDAEHKAPESDVVDLEKLRAQGVAISFQGAGGAVYGWDEKGEKKRGGR